MFLLKVRNCSATYKNGASEIELGGWMNDSTNILNQATTLQSAKELESCLSVKTNNMEDALVHKKIMRN